MPLARALAVLGRVVHPVRPKRTAPEDHRLDAPEVAVQQRVAGDADAVPVEQRLVVGDELLERAHRVGTAFDAWNLALIGKFTSPSRLAMMSPTLMYGP